MKKWYVVLGMKYLMVVLVAFLLVFIGERIGYNKAEANYEIRLEQYERERQVSAISEAENDPYFIQLNEEADMLARVLYGVKDNDTDDLRTYCWCVFNRVDNSAFPDTLEDVIAQPQQWMRYDQTNPILQSMYQVAKEELDKWHTDSHRPVSADYVFMSWSQDDICLRDKFNEGSGVHYWRYGQ